MVRKLFFAIKKRHNLSVYVNRYELVRRAQDLGFEHYINSSVFSLDWHTMPGRDIGLFIYKVRSILTFLGVDGTPYCIWEILA